MLSLDHILSMLLVQSQYSSANLWASQMLLLRYYVDVDMKGRGSIKLNGDIGYTCLYVSGSWSRFFDQLMWCYRCF